MKFNLNLTHWYKENKRDLPWRNTTDPYAIWLSEIILQQTRVLQGLPYYERFLTTYPSVKYLAEAEEQEVLSLWQGLGYYSRARNLYATAKIVTEKYNGLFPSTYSEILKLKGIGPYTAAAIASFAFKLPHPVIDGNVQRVISRVFNIEAPIDTSTGKREIETALNAVFDEEQPDLFNQAIMELGALVCTPQNPKCDGCPLSNNCLALHTSKTNILPIKQGKTKVKSIDFTYFVFVYNTNIYVEKREEGIWQNMYQFPLIEEKISPKNITQKIGEFTSSIENKAEVNLSFKKIHILSHRRINAHFYTIKCLQPPIFLKSNIFELELNKLGTTYPVPVLILEFLKHYKSND